MRISRGSDAAAAADAEAVDEGAAGADVVLTAIADAAASDAAATDNAADASADNVPVTVVVSVRGQNVGRKGV